MDVLLKLVGSVDEHEISQRDMPQPGCCHTVLPRDVVLASAQYEPTATDQILVLFQVHLDVLYHSVASTTSV